MDSVDRIAQRLSTVAPATDTAMPVIAPDVPISVQDDSRFADSISMRFLGLRTLFSVILISFKSC